MVVPNLNEAKYLDKFLTTLCFQTEKNFEVIIVDGGSIDRSIEICNEYKDMLNLKVIVDKTKNIGYIRNLGAKNAKGTILFHTSSDVMLDSHIIADVKKQFENANLISLTARTKPISNKILPYFAYQLFDLLRWAFTQLPNSLKKYRPGGNFFVIRSWVFNCVGGFPEVTINEDGLLGQKIDLFLLEKDKRVRFDLGLCVHHHVKRFEERGSIKTLLFYLYVFGNLFPMLKPLLYSVEAHSGEVFRNRSDLRDFSGRK